MNGGTRGYGDARYGRATTEPGPTLGAARGKKILVVEDSPSARRLLQELLIRLGVSLPDLRLAATVPEALQLFTNWEPEIAIVDLQLRAPPDGKAGGATAPTGTPPPKNGAELAMQLIQRNPNLKVIICSASEPEGTILDPLLQKGRVLSMMKPVLAAKVADTLNRAMQPPAAPSRGR